MRYFQLESNIAGSWSLVRYYRAKDYRELLNYVQPSAGQRLKTAKTPDRDVVVWFFEAGKGLVRWVMS